MTTKNEAIQFLTDANIIINAQNLVYYSQLGDLVKVEYLLLAGVDPNESSSEGYVAIVQAVAYNQKKIVHLLVQNNADLNIEDQFGDNAMLIAFKNKNDEMSRILRENGAKELTQEQKNSTQWIHRMKEVILKSYSTEAYIFLGINLLAFIYMAFINGEGGFFSAIFMIVFASLFGGGILVLMSGESLLKERIKYYKFGASAMIIICLFFAYATDGYVPSSSSTPSGNSSGSSYSSGSQHECTQCGRSYTGVGWTTVGGEQYQPSSDPGYDQCCSKSCAWDSQPSKRKR